MGDVVSAEESIEVVRDYVAATSEWNFERLRELVHPDRFEFRIPWRPEGLPGSVEGADAFFEFAEGWSAQVDGPENLEIAEVDTFGGDPSRVIVIYSSDMVLKASGARYANSHIGLFRVADGRVTEFFEYLDTLPLLAAIGGEAKYTEAH